MALDPPAPPPPLELPPVAAPPAPAPAEPPTPLPPSPPPPGLPPLPAGSAPPAAHPEAKRTSDCRATRNDEGSRPSMYRASRLRSTNRPAATAQSAALPASRFDLRIRRVAAGPKRLQVGSCSICWKAASPMVPSARSAAGSAARLWSRHGQSRRRPRTRSRQLRVRRRLAGELRLRALEQDLVSPSQDVRHRIAGGTDR